jgi:hypothetical protein
MNASSTTAQENGEGKSKTRKSSNPDTYEDNGDDDEIIVHYEDYVMDSTIILWFVRLCRKVFCPKITTTHMEEKINLNSTSQSSTSTSSDNHHDEFMVPLCYPRDMLEYLKVLRSDANKRGTRHK